MMVEWQMSKRRMLPKNWKPQHAVSYSIIGVIYVGIFYLVVSSAAAIDPVYLYFAMLGMSAFVLPVVVHGAIAGERQARSLESLFAAPVTPGQIVVGKMVRALPAFLAVTVSFLALMLFVAFVREVHPNAYSGDAAVSPFTYVLGLAAQLSSSILIVGIGIAVSSMTRTAGAALLGSIGAMLLVFVILPSVVFPFFGLFDDQLPQSLMGGHPFGFLAWMLEAPGGTTKVGMTPFAWTGLATWTLVGIGLMVFATQRLTKERKRGVETR